MAAADSSSATLNPPSGDIWNVHQAKPDRYRLGCHLESPGVDMSQTPRDAIGTEKHSSMLGAVGMIIFRILALLRARGELGSSTQSTIGVGKLAPQASSCASFDSSVQQSSPQPAKAQPSRCRRRSAVDLTKDRYPGADNATSCQDGWREEVAATAPERNRAEKSCRPKDGGLTWRLSHQARQVR